MESLCRTSLNVIEVRWELAGHNYYALLAPGRTQRVKGLCQIGASIGFFFDKKKTKSAFGRIAASGDFGAEQMLGSDRGHMGTPKMTPEEH